MHNIKTISFTDEGYEKLQKDLERLKKEREEVVIRLRTAREMGDLSENGAYKAARFELGSTDRQIRRLQYLLQSGSVVPKSTSGNIGFGNKVTVQSENGILTFTLVDKYESDPQKHMLSFQSPIGKAVLGKKEGDSIQVSTPKGVLSYKIIKVE